ncbi:uncharacterized protein TrAFT101_006946 [Trichoderma asperellum]|uniref:uncharacterized protein n=1 Tax=Trichoderma asperellum TaxID=101201 RepID=UPI0033302E1F|nr:hypothetical protein TrAFT101_006946 [Trichoderma asperellum]
MRSLVYLFIHPSGPAHGEMPDTSHIRPAMCQDRPTCGYCCSIILLPSTSSAGPCAGSHGAARRRRPMWRSAGNTLPAKLLPVSAREFAPTSGNTGGEDKATAMLLV